MIKIFISHSHADDSIAERLVIYLQAALEIEDKEIRCSSLLGYRLPIGASIAEQIKEDVNDTIVLIGLITKDSLQSKWVLFELGSAWALKKLLFPIMGPGLTHDNLPGPLANRIAVEIDDTNPEYRMSEVINQLSQALSRKEKQGEKKQVKLNEFIKNFREWQSKRPNLEGNEQQIAALTSQLRKAEQERKVQLQKISELESSLQSKTVEIEKLNDEKELNLRSPEDNWQEKATLNSQLREFEQKCNDQCKKINELESSLQSKTDGPKKETTETKHVYFRGNKGIPVD